jgi:hypothetical protein
MSINYINASCEVSLGILPGFICINTTSDTLADIMTEGYLNGQTINPTGFLVAAPEFSNLMKALVNTTDYGVVSLQVNIDGENISLITPTSVQ